MVFIEYSLYLLHITFQSTLFPLLLRYSLASTKWLLPTNGVLLPCALGEGWLDFNIRCLLASNRHSFLCACNPHNIKTTPSVRSDIARNTRSDSICHPMDSCDPGRPLITVKTLFIIKTPSLHHGSRHPESGTVKLGMVRRSSLKTVTRDGGAGRSLVVPNANPHALPS